MSERSEEELAELIAMLPPPPGAWTRAAIELPRARAAIEELAVRGLADQRVREAILADLEQALRSTGVDPRPELLETLRTRLCADS